MTTLEYLSNWDIDQIRKVACHLDKFGVVSDEDGYGLPSIWIEKWSDECTGYLRNYGYKGGSLCTIGKYLNGYGAVYGLFDQNKLRAETALEYLIELASRNM
ncbi:hypothetical protein [Marinagarivorans cellulosilyticus]|uniref:Uncharacterized protein n=1 Tax=Marinagarivorans cellulosilyticus TaxID=2721545 RepID=A0AAN1WHM3_9GAMM|nr:hypothetical protein [Marinagarivorans cellulosilyticus]BCD97724.1 hypothetical protein MARGE09_P1925 [Marinagarivorans cellulosilyticus]